MPKTSVANAILCPYLLRSRLLGLWYVLRSSRHDFLFQIVSINSENATVSGQLYLLSGGSGLHFCNSLFCRSDWEVK